MHREFQENPQLWHEYHEQLQKIEKKIYDIDQELIPYRRIINYLAQLSVRATKHVADLGCGRARVSKYFEGDDRFKFYNYDHVAYNSTVIEADISNVPLEDNELNIAILCMAMWESNCKKYISEVWRILEDHGVLLIIGTKERWTNDDGECRLRGILENEGFYIKEKVEDENMDDQYIFYQCVKV